MLPERHFTRRDVANRFQQSFSQWTLTDVKVVTDVPIPLWIVEFTYTGEWAGDYPHAYTLTSSVLYVEIEGQLRLTNDESLPSDCETPEEEDAAVAARYEAF